MTGLRLIPDGQAFYMTGNNRCLPTIDLGR